MNLLLVVVLAASLPTFDEFRRADRERREKGQLQTTDSLRLTRIDPALILRVAGQHPNDPLIQWGAAELLADWEKKCAQFETAIKAGSATNIAVALRFGCVAALNGDAELATRWLRYCEEHDTNNVTPWLAELNVHQRQVQPPPAATEFYDYSAAAARARIALLEAAGYSKYAARRLGFVPEMPALSLARGLIKPPVEKAAEAFVLSAARAMQQGPTFVLTELVGQSVERAQLINETGPAVTERMGKLAERRDELTGMIRAIERGTVDQATEVEMIEYFDDVLLVGEESAMKKLAETVKRHPVE